MKDFKKFCNAAKRRFKQSGRFAFDPESDRFIISDGGCALDCSDLSEDEKTILKFEIGKAITPTPVDDMNKRYWNRWVGGAKVECTPTQLRWKDNLVFTTLESDPHTLLVPESHVALVDLLVEGAPVRYLWGRDTRLPLVVEYRERFVAVVSPLLLERADSILADFSRAWDGLRVYREAAS